MGFCALELLWQKKQSQSNMKYLFYLLTPFFLLLNSACSSPNTLEKEAPVVNEIKVGKQFTIILPENHDERFLWKLNDNYNKSITDNMGAVWHGNAKGIYFRFIALKSGTDTLCFTQFKTQEITKERDSIKTAVYIIKVVD